MLNYLVISMDRNPPPRTTCHFCISRKTGKDPEKCKIAANDGKDDIDDHANLLSRHLQVFNVFPQRRTNRPQSRQKIMMLVTGGKRVCGIYNTRDHPVILALV